MRKYIGILIAVTLLLLPIPALAASFAIGPPTIELEVPADGSAVATFYVTSDFDGELQVSLENIPLKVEPTAIPITKSDNNREVKLTFYGDESLGQQTFDGKVRFLALTGGNIATGIKVKAKVTNLVEEQVVAVTTDEPEELAESTPQAITPGLLGLAWYIYATIGLIIAAIAAVTVVIMRRIRG